jgi:hypothetical protein
MQKNSTREKWKYAADQMRKRQREGKETEVIVNGEVISAKRLKKETTRYYGQDSADDEHAGESPFRNPV